MRQGLWICALAVGAVFLTSGIGAGEAVPYSDSLTRASRLLSESRYDEAAALYKDISVEAGKTGDAEAAFMAQGGLGLTYTALGEPRRGLDLLERNAEMARASGFSYVAAKSEYNAALVASQISTVSPSSQLWLGALRGQAFVKPEKSEVRTILRRAQRAVIDAGTPLKGSIGVKARVLSVNYAYDSYDDHRIAGLLNSAYTYGVESAELDGLLALAEAAMGRMILSPEGNFDELAFNSLTHVLGATTDERTRARATGLLGRLYGLKERKREAMALTGEAILMAADQKDLALQLEFNTQRAALLESYGQYGAALAVYDLVDDLVTQLQSTLAGHHNIELRASMRHLMTQSLMAQVDLILKTGTDSQNELRKARNLMELTKIIEFESYFANPCILSWSAYRKTLDDIPEGTAILYPVTFAEQTQLIVATPEGLKRFSVSTGEADAKQLVAQLNAAIAEKKGARYLAPSQALYDILIRPAEAYLQQSGVKTVVFAPNGAFRGVPLEALHDGQDFLVRKYSVATALSLTLVDARPMRTDPVGLIAGLSEARFGHVELKFVSEEVTAVSALMPGRALRDEAFTTRSIMEAARAIQPSVIHIGSHGQFGRLSEDGYILAYDGKLGFADVRSLVKSVEGQGVDLLTLSACQTARGDDDALLGLAGMAYQTGARSVFGTLWNVDDGSTNKVVSAFYEGTLSQGLSKSEALRRAQVTVLDDPQTRHPYFWAPYVIVGNWF